MLRNYKSYSGNTGENIFFAFLPAYFLYEAAAGILFPKQDIIAYIVGAFFVSYVMFQVFRHRIVSAWLKPFYLFWGYIFILLFFSSRFDYSLKVYSQALIGAMFLPLAFYFIKTLDDLIRLTKSIMLLMIFYLLNIAVSNLFSLGGKSYDRVLYEVPFQMGNIFTTGLNSMTYALILLPWVNRINIKPGKKFITAILAVITMITLLLAAKRISVSGVVVGYFVLFLFQKNRSKVFRILISAGLLMAVFFPVYAGLMYKQMELRSQRLMLDNYEQEGRYMETLIVLDEIFSFYDVSRSLFGKEMFNSPNNYGIRIYNRQLHSDYNVVLHGSGITGLFLFGTAYIVMLGYFLKLRRKIIYLNRRNNYMDYLDAVFISFMIVSLWISFSGGINGVVYNALRNAVIGGILGYYSTIAKTEEETSMQVVRYRITNWKVILNQPALFRKFSPGRR